MRCERASARGLGCTLADGARVLAWQVTRGVPVTHYQEAVAIDAAARTYCAVGQLTQRLVCTPNTEALLERFVARGGFVGAVPRGPPPPPGVAGPPPPLHVLQPVGAVAGAPVSAPRPPLRLTADRADAPGAADQARGRHDHAPNVIVSPALRPSAAPAGPDGAPPLPGAPEEEEEEESEEDDALVHGGDGGSGYSDNDSS